MERGTKVYINDPSHMTKVAATPTYGKNLQTYFFPMILKLGMQHRRLKLKIFYINDDPGLSLTYLTAWSNVVAYACEWGKLLQRHLLGNTCSKWPM